MGLLSGGMAVDGDVNTVSGIRRLLDVGGKALIGKKLPPPTTTRKDG